MAGPPDNQMTPTGSARLPASPLMLPSNHRRGPRKPRILVVVHQASLTGAPRVAIDILSSLDNDCWDRWAVIRWGGPLAKDTRATGSRVVFEPLRRTRATLRRWRRSRWLATWLEQIVAGVVVAVTRADVVWCNTTLSACYVRPARLLGRHVVLHAHEPEDYMRQCLGRYRLERYWDAVTLVGCSPSVCADLAAFARQPVQSVACLRSVPNRDRVLTLAGAGHVDIPAHGLLVGACGVANSGKGIDLWLEMAAQLGPELRDLEPLFLWIGGTTPREFAAWSADGPCSERVRFVGPVDNPYPWLAALDIFVLPSRADSFPLVVIEAMLLGKPVVAFSVGDVAEQVGDAGTLIPPLAVDSLAAAVAGLARDPVERKRLGEAGRRRAEALFPINGFTSGVRRIASSVIEHQAQSTGKGPCVTGSPPDHL